MARRSRSTCRRTWSCDRWSNRAGQRPRRATERYTNRKTVALAACAVRPVKSLITTQLDLTWTWGNERVLPDLESEETVEQFRFCNIGWDLPITSELSS